MTKVVQKEEGVVEEATIEDRVGTLETDVAALKTDVAAIKGGTEEAAKTLKSIETKLARPGIVKRTEDKDEAAELEKKSFGIYLRRGDKAMTEAEIKTLRVSNDPSGGYLAPPEFNSEFIKELIEFSPIRPIASVRSTTSPSVIYPVRTAITNAKWKGEIETREASEPAFGEAEVDVKELTTYVPISNQLLADSGGAAEREVRAALADDFGQKESTAFVNGDGVKAPEGFMTNASVPITVNGHASNLSADALITLMYAVQAAYRNKGTWVMNGNTLATIRKLKDGQNNYLWQPAFTEGQPETILGRPVVDAIDMPEATSGLFPIAFGDFDAAYRIVDRESMSILVDPYTQATNGITRFHASRRVGGKVIRPKAIRKLKMATS